MNTYVITSSSPLVQLLRMLTPGAAPVSPFTHSPWTNGWDSLVEMWGQNIPVFLTLNTLRNGSPSLRRIITILSERAYPSSNSFITEADTWSGPFDEYTPLIGIYNRHFRLSGPFESFAVIPSPNVSYAKMVRDFLASRPPRVEMLVGEFAYQGDGPDISKQPWNDSVFGKLFVYESDSDIIKTRYLIPHQKIVADYETTLDLLWHFPSVTSKRIKRLDGNTAIVMRFSSDRWKTSHVLIKYPNSIFKVLAERKPSLYLFADTIVMVAAMLRYYNIPMNQLAALMLTWWNFATLGLTGYMGAWDSRKSSVLLMQDMLWRAMQDSTLEHLSDMVIRHRRLPEQERAYVTKTLNMRSGDELRFVSPLVRTGLNQYELLRLWNLVRTQLGMDPISTENYIESYPLW